MSKKFDENKWRILAMNKPDELQFQYGEKITAERDEWKNKFTDALACNGRLVEQVEQLTAELAEWKADAERFIQLANFNNKKAGEYFELHEQLVKKYEVTK